MKQMKSESGRRWLALCAVLALLSLSLVLAACDLGGSSDNSTNPGTTATSTLNKDLQNANSQAQTAVSGISTAASGVSTADASSNNDQP